MVCEDRQMGERNFYLALFAGGGLLIVIFSGALARSWVSWSIKLGNKGAQRYERSFRLMYRVIGIAMCTLGVVLWFMTGGA
jgi:hypothetical protein